MTNLSHLQDKETKFAATSRPGNPVELAKWVKVAEMLGFDRIGIADSPALYRDVWISSVHVAHATTVIPFGPWVTNPISRHPVVTASAALSLNELAPGRACVGIGTGNSGVYNLGKKSSTVNHLKLYVEALQSLFQSGYAVYYGKECHLKWGLRPQKIPIYMAAHGSKMLNLAGQLADGVIIGAGATPEVAIQAYAALGEGANKVGRTLGDLDIWWSIPFNIQHSPTPVLDPQGGAAREANYLARYTLEGKFIPDQHKEGIKQLALVYDISTHGRPTQNQLETYDRLAQKFGVKDYLADRFAGLSGTPEEIIEIIKRNQNAGIDQYSINIPDDDRIGRLSDIMTSVISRL